MRTYQVFMKDRGNSVEVKADDVDLDSVNGDETTAFWNFLIKGEDDDFTVAAFPFTRVDFITSA